MKLSDEDAQFLKDIQSDLPHEDGDGDKEVSIEDSLQEAHD